MRRRITAVLGLLGWTAALAATGCLSVKIGPRGPEPLEETVVSGTSGPKILLLEIDGVIRGAPEKGPFLTPDRESTVAKVREQLDRARRDSQVRALLVRVDSPGGPVTASDVVYREILEFKKERRVPVVAQLMGVAASGGYYVAMAADTVVAEPTGITGSIGVIFVNLDLTGLLGKIGVKDRTLTAGARKDEGSWLRRMTPEERAQLQSILDDLHQRFQGVVVAGRPGLDAEAVARLADGRIYSADQALAAGLIDRLGGLPDAVAEAKKRAGLSEARVVTYHRPSEWKQNLYTRPWLPSRIEVGIDTPWPRLRGPGFFYLWSPGQ